MAYHDNAIAFLEQFPLETQFTSDSFNEWAATSGLLTVPAQKYGTDWEGFRRSQHVLINHLRSAGRHPRMLTESPQGVCFDIENLSSNLWKVRPTNHAIIQANMARPASLALAAQKKHFMQWCQGAELDRYPELRHYAENALFDIQHAERSMALIEERCTATAARTQAYIVAVLTKKTADTDDDNMDGAA